MSDRLTAAARRSVVLLRATMEYLDQYGMKDGEVFYDGVMCDGSCLKDDCDIAINDIEDAITNYAGGK